MNSQYDKSVENLEKDFRYDLQKFIYSNGVISSAVSFSIGTITKEVISSVLDQLLLPFILNTLKYIYNLRIFQPLYKKLKNVEIFHDIGHIIWLLLIWFLTIILAYLLLEKFFNRYILGLKTHIPNGKKQDFIESRLSTGGVYINAEDEK